MDKLKVNTSDLRDISDSLKVIGDEFQDANENSDQLADAVGEPTLAGHIRDFATNWDVRRKDFVDKISKLQQNVEHGADEFDKTDQDLSDSLTDDSTTGSKK